MQEYDYMRLLNRLRVHLATTREMVATTSDENDDYYKGKLAGLDEAIATMTDTEHGTSRQQADCHEELTRNQLARLDEMFEEYQDVDRELSKQEFEIRYPYREPDTNIGGGHGAVRNDGEQKLLEAIESNPRIIYLRQLKTSCAAAVSHMTQGQLALYSQRYRTTEYMTWQEIGETLGYTKASIYRKRYSLLALLAVEVGWCER